MEKLNLSDCTFCIPVFLDSQDRQENIEIAYNFLNTKFDTNILVGEMGTNSVLQNVPVSKFQPLNNGYFHKTKMLNDLYKLAKTPIVVMYDADVQFIPSQLINARDRILNGADMVYPFLDKFYTFNRIFIDKFKNNSMYEIPLSNAGVNVYEEGKGMLLSSLSYGGCSFHNKESFIKCGLENENCISYGNEDTEKYHRLRQLKMRIERTEGILYHLDHVRYANSLEANPYAYDNSIICNNMGLKSKQDILNEISTWEWIKNI